MNKAYGFVYIWYDRYRCMYYIGSHHGSVSDGYIGSSKWFRRAYKRRPYDFKRRILQWNFIDNSRITLDLETRWLQLIKVNEIRVRYYNLKCHAVGGNTLEGYSQERKEAIYRKLSEARRGKPRVPPMTQENVEALRQANIGRPLSKQHKEKLSQAGKGKSINEKQRAALLTSSLGRVMNDRTRIALLIANVGRPLSISHRIKLSSVTAGTKWITDGTKSMRITPKESIPVGWRFGRAPF
jgi:NUMOD3 motif-containing protein